MKFKFWFFKGLLILTEFGKLAKLGRKIRQIFQLSLSFKKNLNVFQNSNQTGYFIGRPIQSYSLLYAGHASLVSKFLQGSNAVHMKKKKGMQNIKSNDVTSQGWTKQYINTCRCAKINAPRGVVSHQCVHKITILFRIFCLDPKNFGIVHWNNT